MKLQDLLQDDRERCLTLLRKALDPSNALLLTELKKALELDWVVKHLEGLTVADVSRKTPAPSGGESTIRPHGVRRIRLSDERRQEVRDLLLGTAQQSPGIPTGDLTDAVTAMFPEVRKEVALKLLNDLSKEGILVGTATRPMKWSAAPKGQKAEPMTVKKANRETIAN